jgi:hypothetical protein
MPIFYEKGRYRVRVIDQALGKASTGTPQFVLKFTVIGKVIGPDALADVTQYDRTSYHYITEKTAERFAQDLRQIGFFGDSFQQLSLDHPEAHDFRSAELDMYCGEDKNQNGEPRERWSFAMASAGLDVQPLDRKSARELDSLFGRHLKAAKPPAAKAAPATSAAASTVVDGITDDDVHF